MELALPHVVVRICGPGVGVDVVSALSTHPVEVSEARDLPELHRVSSGRPAVLVVIVDPPDTRVALAETWGDFPGVPVLVVSDSAEPVAHGEAALQRSVEVVRSGQSLPNICWDVMHAISQAAGRPDLAEHPLGPCSIDVDERGVVTSEIPFGNGLLFSGRPPHAGACILSVVDPLDRDTLAHILGRLAGGDAEFCALRLLNDRGIRHTVAVGGRSIGPGRVRLLVQPLISGGPIVGRHINNRDPITGLLTRWAMSRALETHEKVGTTGNRAFLLLLKLTDFAAISSYIGHRRTDAVLNRVASALNTIFPHPAINSRLMGDVFLTLVPEGDADSCLRSTEQLLQEVRAIEVAGFAPGFNVRGSIGMAVVTGADHDLAFRLAEAAAVEAQAAGGDRTVVAGAANFTRAQTGELNACMDRGAWEVWLQPVAGRDGGGPVFHETLARFDVGQRRVASRADFFTAGRAEGLLERFDRMMLQRALEILGAHPDAKLSVNVSYESFVASSFPAGFLQLIGEIPHGPGRIILEIAPRCMAAPPELVRRRLQALAEAGVAVALDDFGSGICRLQYLTQVPLAFVKLDELVTGYVDDDPLQREFVRTVVSLCRARGITTVAEYTRSPEQLSRLVEDGVDLFQGELFGMPRPAPDVLANPGSGRARV